MNLMVGLYRLLPIFLLCAFSIGVNPLSAQDTLPPIVAVQWSPDGQEYAVLDALGMLQVFRTSDGALDFSSSTRTHLLPRASLAWSPSGTHLAAGIGYQVLIWDAATWSLSSQFVSGEVDGEAFIPNDQILYPESVVSLNWSRDGGYLIAGSAGFVTSVWDFAQSILIFQRGDLSGGGPGRVWLGDGWMSDGVSRLNAFTDEDITVRRSELQNPPDNGGGVYAAEPNPRSWEVGWATLSGRLSVADLQSMERVASIRVAGRTADNYAIGLADLSWDSSGQYVGTIDNAGNAFVVNVTSEEVSLVRQFPADLYSIDWSPTSNELLIGGIDDQGSPLLIMLDASGFAGVPNLPTPTPTPTDAPTATSTPTDTPTATFTSTPSATLTSTFTPTFTSTFTLTPTAAFTPTPTATFTPTDTPTFTPTNTFTPTFTPTPTETFTPSPTFTLTATETFTPTFTPTPSVICTATIAASDALGLVNAINAANGNGNSADTVCLTANSTYSFFSATSSIALPSITTPITIVGNSAILERGGGAPNFRLFNVTTSGSLTLQNVTLRNGNTSGGNGGAILNTGSVTLNGVTVTSNSARFAGGIHSSRTLVIANSTLTSNTSQENAGAIYLNSGTLTMTDSTVESNSARYGSGVYLNNGTATLTNVTFRSNTANEQGAGVYQRTGTLSITGGLFESNTARFGNGVYVDAGTTTLSGAIMRNSMATEEGAAIYNRTGTLSVSGSTFDNNRGRYGAAISNRGLMTVSGSVFTGNIAVESGGAVYHQNANVENGVAQSCFTGNTARFGGAVFSQTGNFNAQNNWWGAASGPTGAMVNANVLTAPFLTAGCPN